MNLRSAAPLLALALALVPAAAQAQTTTTPEKPVKKPPRAGDASIAVSGGLATTKMRYAARFQELVVNGRVKPYVAGEAVTLHVVRKGKERKQVRREVGRRGRYSIPVQLAMDGRYRLFVTHERSESQAAFRTRAKRVTVVDWQAGQGASGLKVLLLQRGLEQIGFATPKTGSYDWLTANAVNAFRKTNGMGRVGYASKSVYAKVFRGEGAYKLRFPKAGKHVEFDWTRQVLVLADKGRPYRVYHTSSGAPVTPTVFGSYRFYLQTPGTNSNGMVHSSYFIRGYAIHGYASVPNYPASHGCLRVPIPNAASIFGWIDIGDPIFLYR